MGKARKGNKMNQVTLLGRLTKDPETRYTQGENPKTVARFTLAVDRGLGKRAKEGQQTTDFISCEAWGSQGTFAEKFLKKGSLIIVHGRIQTGNYTNKDGNTVYTTTVNVSGYDFVPGQKKEQENADGNSAPVNDASASDFMDAPDDEELPFN